jgi:FdhD protein
VSDAVRAFGAVHVDAGAMQSREERVAHEEPLEIQINGASVAVLMRTPGDDEELATGFLLTERIVASVNDVESVRHCTTVPTPEAEENVVQVRLTASTPFDLERLRRHTFASSSCGVCGKATIENACALAPPLDDDVRVAPAVLSRMVASLRAAQSAFDETGGLHGAGAFTSHGALVLAREDVGRHNAVDKVIGACARQGLAMPEVLLVSGRVSFEIVQKAAAARVPIVAGVSAPTSLAIRMARALNVTLVGFLRGNTMNVYAAEQRVHGAAAT